MPEVTLEGTSGRETLAFRIDGEAVSMAFRVERLSRDLLADLPPVLHDLLDIAATVYAADLSTSRGGLTASRVGADWRRDFHCTVPVRCPEIWARPDLQAQLGDTLGFLSDDNWRFSFTGQPDTGPRGQVYLFGPEDLFRPDRVAMFSGGLDSLAGAAEAVLGSREKIVLVSHGGATKIAPLQKTLAQAVGAASGPGWVQHVTLTATLKNSRSRERTQRSRSFLYAALGLIVARLHGQDRVTFYENGIVSLNLPPVGNVVGARATRTTHPRVLASLGQLFSGLLEHPIEVVNPFIWRTKGEIMQRIADLGLGDQIGQAHSCADTHNRTKMHPHCGRCSQCIDRRFAALARGLERFDHGVDYAVDLLDGVRVRVQDREMALAYVRNARFFRSASPEDLVRRFPALIEAVGHLGQAPEPALGRLHDLFRRFGTEVTSVMEREADRGTGPEGSLRALYRQADLPETAPFLPFASAPDREDQVLLELDEQSAKVTIGGLQSLGAATSRLLEHLARLHLACQGKGFEPLDHEASTATALMQDLGYESEDSVRRAVQTARRRLAKLFRETGRDDPELIETVTGFGYRLRPDVVTVRVLTARPRRR